MYMVKEKNNRQIPRKKIRIAIISACASIILLGTTTFAWFTLTNQAKVYDIKLKAGTESGLLIGHSEDTLGMEPIEFVCEDDGVSYCIRPITTVDGTTFHAPIYGSKGIVVDVEDSPLVIDDIANKVEGKEGYMLTYTFYLKAESNSITEPVGIRLASAQAAESGEGTKVLRTDDAQIGAEAAVRMSFTANGTTTIYEPNADKVVKSRDVQAEMEGWSRVKTIKQTGDAMGMFAEETAVPYANVEYDSSVSPELFKIPINTATKVTLNIWLEGADEDCVNDIAADELISNITFICTELN